MNKTLLVEFAEKLQTLEQKLEQMSMLEMYDNDTVASHDFIPFISGYANAIGWLPHLNIKLPESFIIKPLYDVDQEHIPHYTVDGDTYINMYAVALLFDISYDDAFEIFNADLDNSIELMDDNSDIKPWQIAGRIQIYAANN